MNVCSVPRSCLAGQEHVDDLGAPEPELAHERKRDEGEILVIGAWPWRHRNDDSIVSNVGADEIRSMLVQLAGKPDDAELRRRVAEAIDQTIAGGADRAAIDAVLAPLINLTGHDDDAGLPCLCRDCLARAGTTAESAGMKFQRSFVTVGKRVLHFWMLDDVASDRENVRRSVASALRTRLGRRGE